MTLRVTVEILPTENFRDPVLPQLPGMQRYTKPLRARRSNTSRQKPGVILFWVGFRAFLKAEDTPSPGDGCQAQQSTNGKTEGLPPKWFNTRPEFLRTSQGELPKTEEG